MTRSVPSDSKLAFKRLLKNTDFNNFSQVANVDENFSRHIKFLVKNLLSTDLSVEETHEMVKCISGKVSEYKKFHDIFLISQISGKKISRYNLMQVINYKKLMYELLGNPRKITEADLDNIFKQELLCLETLKSGLIGYVDGDVDSKKKDKIYKDIEKTNEKLRAICYFKEKKVLK